MPRQCTVCSHPRQVEIDKALIDGRSIRDIAKRFELKPAAVNRHKGTHLAQLLAENAAPAPIAPVSEQSVETKQYAAGRERQDQTRALDLMGQLTRQVERANLLSDAVDAWLRDPEDPSRYTIVPRAEDVTVIYHEEVGEIVEGVKMVGPRRKARLSELLGRLEGAGLQIEATETKHADPRELLLKTSDAVKGQMQLLLAVLEKLHNAQEIARFEAAVLDAIGEVAPDVRTAILDNLQRRRPVRRVLGAGSN